MMRPTVVGTLAALVFVATAAAGAVAPATAETVVYTFPALPGPVANCQWFDDNLNDRSVGALIRQTDLLYNRLALPADATVTITANGTTALGAQLAGFDLNRRHLCSDASAFHPESEASPSPAP